MTAAICAFSVLLGFWLGRITGYRDGISWASRQLDDAVARADAVLAAKRSDQ